MAKSRPTGRPDERPRQGLQKDCRVKPQIVVVGATRTGAVSAFLRQHLNQTEAGDWGEVDSPRDSCEGTIRSM